MSRQIWNWRCISLWVFVLVVGCSTPTARAPLMTALGLELDHSHPVTVSTAVDARKTSWLTESDPGFEPGEFHEALNESIRASRLFAGLSDPATADYQLRVQVDDVKHPALAMTMRVSIKARWSLSARGIQQPIWSEVLETQGSVEPEFTMNGYERRRMAVEAAARANIAKGLETLSRLDSPELDGRR